MEKKTENSIKTNYSKVKNTNQFVSFKIEKEIFAIEVSKVKEVLYISKITKVPNAYPYMIGVMDLRGTIVPLIDTRTKFKLPSRNYDSETVIIIIDLKNMLLGMIVDSVLDVANLSESNNNPGEFSETDEMKKNYVKGITKNNNDLIILLDVNKIFTDEELAKLEQLK